MEKTLEVVLFIPYPDFHVRENYLPRAYSYRLPIFFLVFQNHCIDIETIGIERIRKIIFSYS